jgi:hypothetical protein
VHVIECRPGAQTDSMWAMRVANAMLTLAMPAGAGHAQVAGTSILTGIVTGDTGPSPSVLPGVTVKIEGPGILQTATSDANGRFAFEGLFQAPPARYVVTGALPGFRTAVRAITVTPGGSTRIPILHLDLGCIYPDLPVYRGVATEVGDADVIAHVRIETSDDERDWELDRGCVVARRATAIVIADGKGTRRGRTISMLLPRAPVARAETISFLTWDRKARVYTSFAMDLPVLHRVVAWPYSDEPPGLDPESSVPALLEWLTSFVR